MTGRLGAWAVPRQALLLSVVATVVLIAAIVVAYLAGGTQGALAIGMGILASLRPALSLRPLHSFALAVPTAMAGGVAVALRGQPLVAAFFVVLCCLLVAPAGMLQDGLLAMVPTVVAVLVLVPGEFQPGRTAIWMLFGGALVVALATRLPRTASVPGIEERRAWRHAAVMAVAVGVVVYFVGSLDLPHGYWVALTLTAVLRPFDDQTMQRSRERVLGTIAGALLALAATLVLPLWALLVLLVVTTVLSTGYALTKDYTRQVLFMTPAVVLLGSAGHPFQIASERALATFAGALLAAAIALGLATFENRRTAAAS
ncbi:MAG TPA: FUSC family protein [Propionicimonas sp.]|uniref:FUSC family protein n=1 Tax=Propionicimonas sp. TaxID=1955623 RepID=UPI002F3E6846